MELLNPQLSIIYKFPKIFNILEKVVWDGKILYHIKLYRYKFSV